METTKAHKIFLPEGQYVLTQDVENPSADRRHKRSLEYMVTWTAGMKFDVRVHTFDYEAVSVEYNVIQSADKYGQISTSHDGFDALIAALTPVDRTTASLAHRAEKGYTGVQDFFDTLVDGHGWTLDQIEDLVKTTIQRVDEEES